MPVKRKSVGSCTYCGVYFASDRDHVSYSARSHSQGKRFDVGEIVLSCRECNVLLANVTIYNVNDRKKYLYSKYQVRYRILLSTPEWDEVELQELGLDLQRSIRFQLGEKERIMQMLVYLSNHI